jgi:chromosome segregation ATPase
LAVPVGSSLALAASAPLCESLAQLRQACAGLDEFVGALFDELRQLYRELDERREQLDAARRELALDRDQLGKQRHILESDRAMLDRRETDLQAQVANLDAYRAELDKRRNDLEQLRTEAERRQAEARAAAEQLGADKAVFEKARLTSGGSSEEIESLRREFQQLAGERDRLRTDLDAAHDRITSLAATAVDAAESRALLASARAEASKHQDELARVREQLQSAELSLVGGTADERSPDLADVETQLEMVRERAAELADRLDDKEQEFAAERRRLQAELAEARQNTEREPSVGGDGAATLNRRTANNPRATNPVIDSVAAQFRLVQRDAARRRAAK